VSEHTPWSLEAPPTWDEVVWPNWVPVRIREQIKSFWSCFGRIPDDYDAAKRGNNNKAPPFGALVMVKPRRGDGWWCGRYVHAWNNMGRVVRNDGSYECVATFEVIEWPSEGE